MTTEEYLRYNRHIILPELGEEGQLKLKQAKVLVIGAGGLGSPLLLYLAAAGVGKIGIVDFDIVEASNLQRQVLFTTNDIGKNKAKVAKLKIESLNPYIQVEAIQEKLTSNNALDIIKEYDVVADGSDNFPTRYLVNDSCVILDKVNIYASIYRFEGQVSVFNFPPDKEDSPNYRDLYPTPPPPELVPNCAEGGVLGVLPGIIGSMQANEVIKVVAGIGNPLVSRVFIFDALKFENRIIKFTVPKSRTLIKALIDYEEFCNIGESKKNSQKMKEITTEELKKWMDNREDFQLIDVREPFERDIANIGGDLIPMDQIIHHHDKISNDKKVVLYCRSGQRSGIVVRQLQQEANFKNLYNLKGGILAWSDTIDSKIQKY